MGEECDAKFGCRFAANLIPVHKLTPQKNSFLLLLCDLTISCKMVLYLTLNMCIRITILSDFVCYMLGEFV